MQIVFSVDGNIVIDEAFGYSNLTYKVPSNKKNYHKIASISKTITRLAIKELVKRRYLRSETKVF